LPFPPFALKQPVLFSGPTIMPFERPLAQELCSPRLHQSLVTLLVLRMNFFLWTVSLPPHFLISVFPEYDTSPSGRWTFRRAASLRFFWARPSCDSRFRYDLGRLNSKQTANFGIPFLSITTPACYFKPFSLSVLFPLHRVSEPQTSIRVPILRGAVFFLSLYPSFLSFRTHNPLSPYLLVKSVIQKLDFEGP